MKTFEMQYHLCVDFWEKRTTEHILPIDWCRRFAWKNEEGVEEMPDLEVPENFKAWAPEDANFTLKCPKVASEEYKSIEQGLRVNLCGSGFKNEKQVKRRRNEKTNPVIIWTRMGRELEKGNL